jgi:hypothetical protein
MVEPIVDCWFIVLAQLLHVNHRPCISGIWATFLKACAIKPHLPVARLPQARFSVDILSVGILTALIVSERFFEGVERTLGFQMARCGAIIRRSYGHGAMVDRPTK